MRSWVKGLIAGGTAILLLAAFGFGYDRVNRAYPAPVRAAHTLGETFETNGLEITGTDSRLMSIAQFREQYPDIIVDIGYQQEDGSILPEENVRILLASVRVKILSEGANIPFLYSAGVQSGTWRNGMSFDLFAQLIDLVPDTDGYYHLILPYQILSLQFLEKDWETVESRSYEIVFSLYPTRHILQLET